MKTISAVLFLLSTTVAWAQSGFTGVFTRREVKISIQSKLEPPKPDLGTGFATGISGGAANGMHRFLYDRSAHEYFGYDILIKQIDNNNEFRMTFRKLSLKPEELKLANPSVWKMIAAPAFPEPQIVHSGDTVTFELFENPKTGQKIVDYVRFETTQANAGSENDLEDATRVLAADLQSIEADQDQAGREKLKQSQQSWKKYRDDACQATAEGNKRVECELELTRNRIRELRALYPASIANN